MADTYSAGTLRSDVDTAVVTQGESFEAAEPAMVEVVAEDSEKTSATAKVLQAIAAFGIGATSLLGF